MEMQKYYWHHYHNTKRADGNARDGQGRWFPCMTKFREELWHLPEEGSHSSFIGASAREGFSCCRGLHETGGDSASTAACGAAVSFCRGAGGCLCLGAGWTRASPPPEAAEVR